MSRQKRINYQLRCKELEAENHMMWIWIIYCGDHESSCPQNFWTDYPADEPCVCGLTELRKKLDPDNKGYR